MPSRLLLGLSVTLCSLAAAQGGERPLFVQPPQLQAPASPSPAAPVRPTAFPVAAPVQPASAPALRVTPAPQPTAPLPIARPLSETFSRIPANSSPFPDGRRRLLAKAGQPFMVPVRGAAPFNPFSLIVPANAPLAWW